MSLVSLSSKTCQSWDGYTELKQRLGHVHGNGHCLPYPSPYICIYTDLEEGMATHSSILTWRISWTEKPGWLQSMGLQRIRHDWTTKHSTAYTHIYFQIYVCIYTYIYTLIFKKYLHVYTRPHTFVLLLKMKYTIHYSSTHLLTS